MLYLQTHVDNDFKRKLIDFSDEVKHPVCKIDIKKVFVYWGCSAQHMSVILFNLVNIDCKNI
jgi:hypothetical protein